MSKQVPHIISTGALADGWVHVCPLGEYTWKRWEDGKVVETIVQVIDREACEAMAASYPLSQPASLIDLDHESMDKSKRTAAVGWGKRAEVRDNGLWVQIEWTPEGRALVADKVYRFNSPVFPREGLVHLDGERYRVTQLGTIALTNDPNLRGQEPLTNRRPAANPNQTNKTMDIKATLLALLGLPAEATDEQIKAAAEAVKGDKPKVDALNKRIQELQTQLANRDLDEHGIKDEAQRALLAPMLTNSASREATLALIKSKAPVQQQPIHNRAGAPVPGTDRQLSQAEEADQEAEKVKGTWIGNRARELKAANPNRAHRDCFGQAEGEYSARKQA